MVCFDLMFLTAVPVIQRDHPEIFAGLEVEFGKSGFWRTKGVISLKRDESKSDY